MRGGPEVLGVPELRVVEAGRGDVSIARGEQQQLFRRIERADGGDGRVAEKLPRAGGKGRQPWPGDAVGPRRRKRVDQGSIASHCRHGQDDGFTSKVSIVRSQLIRRSPDPCNS